MTSPGPLAGRVALVTGASRRSAIGAAIGAAIVRRLCADGAAVLVHAWAFADGDRADPGGAEQLAEELRAEGGNLALVDADLADPATPARLVDLARASFGRLDIVIANHARAVRQSLEDLTAGELDLTYAVNTRATLLLVQRFAEQFDGTTGGRVVIFTSGQYHGVMPAELPYTASKAALRELTPTLATHLIRRGITVNCVNPGPNDNRPRRRRRVGVGRPAQPGRPCEHAPGHGSPGRMARQRRGRVGDGTGHRVRRRLVQPRRVTEHGCRPDPRELVRGTTARREPRSTR